MQAELKQSRHQLSSCAVVTLPVQGEGPVCGLEGLTRYLGEVAVVAEAGEAVAEGETAR